MAPKVNMEEGVAVVVAVPNENIGAVVAVEVTAAAAAPEPNMGVGMLDEAGANGCADDTVADFASPNCCGGCGGCGGCGSFASPAMQNIWNTVM